MNKVHHCIVVTCFSERQPGFLDFSYRIHALARQYQLVILSQDELDQPELRVAGAQYVALGRGQGKRGWLSYVWKCAAFIRKHRPDVAVLMHSSAAPVALLVGNIPTCLYWNEHPTNLIQLPETFSPLRYCLNMASQNLVFQGARRSCLLLPIGEEHRDDLLARKCRSERIEMQYMGVADDFFDCQQSGHSASDPLRLIYIGSVSKPRGRDVMLDAMALLGVASTQAHLTIVGADDSEIAYCRERIRTLRVEDTVTIMGRVPGCEIPHYLARADAGICLWEDRPWWRFNPPTKLFEYLAAGLPVLASDIRTHTRYIENGHNGLVFSYGAVDLARAIGEMAVDRNRLQQMRSAALHSGKTYLWSGIEPAFLNAVARVVET